MRLLPYNSTPQEIALEQTTASRIEELPVPVKTIWNADTCPVNFLPWLGWALSVDVWRKDWTEEQKRNAIREASFIHRYKGTVASVKAALKAAGFTMRLYELPTGIPYTFSVDVDVSDAGITPELYNTCLSIIDETKNARSHLLSLKLKSSIKSERYYGSRVIIGTRLTIYPYTPEKIVSTANKTYGVGLRYVTKTTIYPQ